jgi:hypothetical protein
MFKVEWLESSFVTLQVSVIKARITDMIFQNRATLNYATIANAL